MIELEIFVKIYKEKFYSVFRQTQKNVAQILAYTCYSV